MVKIGRNEICPCGSDLKFKKCCGKDGKSDLQELIRSAQRRSLEYDLEARKRSHAIFLNQNQRTDLSANERLAVDMALAQSLQKLGNHIDAINKLEEIIKYKPDEKYTNFLIAKSLDRIGRHDEAVQMHEYVLPYITETMGERGQAFALIEHGRACSGAGQGEKAIKSWTDAATILKELPEEIEHYARALSNIAGEQLHSSDSNEQALGEKGMSYASELKAQCGDIEGLSNNYSRLSMYYFRRERYERSIAFARKDLMLARTVGDDHGIAASLGNISVIYMRMLQFSAARSALSEARSIGERLRQQSILNMVDVNSATLNHAGREAGQAGLKVGPVAECACNSGKIYKDCCGRADFEPSVVLPGFRGFSQEAAALRSKSRKSGNDWLAHVLRKTEDSQRRLSWSEVVGHDGWLEAFELADMSNLHLIAARSLAQRPDGDHFGFEAPLSACILSVCSSEAFINTLAYFAEDAAAKDPHSGLKSLLPPPLVADKVAYQRQTELTQKWTDLGKSLCGPTWPPAEAWNNFKILISIRNELVHFKAVGYERVIPPPKHAHELLRKLPNTVEIRDVPHSWPMRVLTPSFALWCVNVVSQLIDSFKDSYAANNNPKTE